MKNEIPEGSLRTTNKKNETKAREMKKKKDSSNNVLDDKIDDL